MKKIGMILVSTMVLGSVGCATSKMMTKQPDPRAKEQTEQNRLERMLYLQNKRI